MKNFLSGLFLMCGLLGGSNAHAVVPVVDGPLAGLVGTLIGTDEAGHAATVAAEESGWLQDMANFIETKIQWVEEAIETFKTQTVLGQSLMTAMDGVDKIQEQVENLEQIRDNARYALENRLAPDKQTLPYDYTEGLRNFQASMDTGGGTASTLSTFDNIVLSITDAVGLTSDDVVEESIARASYNRALAETAYRQAGDRRADIVAAQIAVENAPEAKDVLDAQARMMALQMDTLNEQIRVQSLILMTAAQEDVQRQKEKQERLKTLEMSPKSLLVDAVAAGVAWNI